MQTHLADWIKDTPAGHRGRRDPAQVRALRLLPRHVPHLHAAGRRARQPARAHLPHEADARGRAGHRAHAAAPRPLPHLPRVRDHVPLGRGVRQAGGHRPRPGGGEGAARAAASALQALGARAARCRRARLFGAALGPGRAVRGRAARGARAQDPRAARPRARGPRRATRAACWCSRAACSPSMAPSINAATARVLDRLGISLVEAPARRLLRRRHATTSTTRTRRSPS